MSDDITNTIISATEVGNESEGGVSRRTLFAGGFGAVAGAGALMGVLQHGVADARPMQPQGLRPEALASTKSYLQYVGIDAQAFTTRPKSGPSAGGYVSYFLDDTSGVEPLDWTNYVIWAPLSLPAGSVIREINLAYQGDATIVVLERKMGAPNPVTQHNVPNVPTGVMASTVTLALDGTPPFGQPITISATSTYTIEMFGSPGSSIYGITIGYVPPTQSFIPFVGTPRVLDTRDPAIGGGGKLSPGEERTIALGFPGARGAVLNLTLADTEGNGGFVAVFPANIAWPLNSSINWSGPNEFIANGVITALDAAGQIKIRGGSQKTSVIIDRIGWLI